MPRIPAWALPTGPIASDVEAAFFSGAALTHLDTLIRSTPVWAGAWRQRLALQSAAASMHLISRREDQQALRDAWLLRQPGAEPGPAGDVLAAWKRLAGMPPRITEDGLQSIARLLGVRWSDELLQIPSWMDGPRQAKKPAPFAAAAIIGQIYAARPDARLLAYWCGDLVLASQLHWPSAVPLIAGQTNSSAFRLSGDHGRIRPGDPTFERALCLALAEACTTASKLAADMARRAERLAAVAPKLRAKGAGEVIHLLLEEDAVSGGLQTKNLSRWGARRLFERLTAQDAVRELSGRSSFKLYGL